MTAEIIIAALVVTVLTGIRWYTFHYHNQAGQHTAFTVWSRNVRDARDRMERYDPEPKTIYKVERK